jgi:hypothetical protein
MHISNVREKQSERADKFYFTNRNNPRKPRKIVFSKEIAERVLDTVFTAWHLATLQDLSHTNDLRTTTHPQPLFQ